ncbi:MAG: hypothetical protein NT150_14915 [Bacteroidetes bacterium]|nr:hypothetical protein [Bacteroidota bacterium]
MKSPNYFCLIAIVAISSLFFSCKKDSQALTEDSVNLVGKTADYSDPISQQRVDLAKTLVEAFKTNPEMATQTISACNEKFDGDRNVLCSTLFSQTVSAPNAQTSKTNGTKTFGTVLNELASIEGSNKTGENFSENLIENDSLIQLYFFLGNSNDSLSFEGIVIRPFEIENNVPIDLLVINKDGSETTVRSDIDPTKNYLVVSSNERSGHLTNENNIDSNQSSFKTQATRATKITRASFTSYSALRSVEAWLDGEPDIKSYVVYNLGGTAQLNQFYWPKQWLGGTKVKWNYVLITLPIWNTADQDLNRKFIFIEEDSGNSTTRNVNLPLANGATLSTTISGTTKDITVSESYVNFFDTSVEHNWGSFKFDLN